MFCDMTHAREVCKALKYEKVARRVVRHHCTRENIQLKHQLVVITTIGATVNWPRDSQKLDLYINEEGMHELLFSRQQPKAIEFRIHCCNVFFPYFWQQLKKKIKERHQQAIEEKDAATALLNYVLQNREYENVALQAQRDVYQAQLEKFQD